MTLHFVYTMNKRVTLHMDKCFTGGLVFLFLHQLCFLDFPLYTDSPDTNHLFSLQVFPHLIGLSVIFIKISFTGYRFPVACDI